MKKLYVLLLALFCIGTTRAQYTKLLDFSSTNGYTPSGTLTISGNKLFGVQSQGGINGLGCVYSVNLNGTGYRDLHDFNSTSGGDYPSGQLTISGAVMYGMCTSGGLNGYGVIFSVDTNGTAYTDMHDFTSANSNPQGNSLTLAGSMLFGMTTRGGANTQGMIFSIQTNGNGFKDIHDFAGPFADGSYPYGSVTVSGNVMYGMTYNGGQNFVGIIFSMDTNGTAYTKLMDLNVPVSAEPEYGALTLAGTTLYGMSLDGGTYNTGTVFSIRTNGSGYRLMHSFDSADGYWPYASLTLSGKVLYGMTYGGGVDKANNAGVIFSIDTDGTAFTNLHDFSGTGGYSPTASLTLSGSNLYGTTSGGGANNWGVLFRYFSGTCNLTATASWTNVTCFGANNGTATAFPSGGTSPYTYSWSSGQTTSTAVSLAAGIYTVTISDVNGCNATASAIITQPPKLKDTISESPKILCNGGITTLVGSASGGTPVYSYLWTPSGNTNNNLTGISSGTYTLTVTDGNGCTNSFSITVSQPPKLRDSISSSTNILCNGGTGSATVGVKGGITPYTYNWNPGGRTTATATGLTAGSYTVTVTDHNGCTATATVTLTQPILLTATAVGTNVSCNGGNNGTGTATQSGGTSPYTYSWSGGGTNLTKTGLTAGTYTITVTDHNGCTATASITITQPTLLTTTINVNNNVTCNGNNNGSLSGNPSGGTPVYTYSWNPGGQTTATATGLSAGSYTLTVTDNHGCTATASTIITQPPLLTVTATASLNVTCFGGNNGYATSTPAGGTAPYTYLWNPGGNTTPNSSGLSAGTYTLNLTDSHGCTASATVTITQPTLLTVSTTVTAEVTCNGGNNGSASATPAGGISPYTYSWSGGGTNSTKTGMTAGAYTITVTDHNGCLATATATITQPSLLHDSITINSNVSCNGGNNGSVTALVSGGVSPYTYLWTPGGQTTATVTGLSAGTYTNTAVDSHGCSATATVTITQPPILAVTTTVTANVSCNGGNNGSASSTLTGGTSPYTYLWSPGGGTNSTKSSLTAGTYTVTVTDNHGCTASATSTITQPTVLKDSIVTSLTVNNLCSTSSNGSAKVGVKGGITPYTYLWSNGKTTATITGLSNGSYTATVKDHNGCSHAATVTITSPAAIRDSVASMTGPTCNGGGNGSVTVGVKGGTSPYTYVWSPNTNTTATASGLSTTTYTVSIQDKNGCSSTLAFILTQPAAIRDTIIPASYKNISCFGLSNGAATVGVKGGTSPYTYSWSPNGKTTAAITGLSVGTYSVTVTDKNGCTSSVTTVTITQPALLKDSITTFSCVAHLTSATVGVKGGTSPYTYFWSPGGGTKATMAGLLNGTYTITVTDKNGCTATVSQAFHCTIAPPPHGPLQDTAKNECCKISIYPNPTMGQYTLTGLVKGMIIEMYDYTGKRISSSIADNESMLFNISNQPNGIYLIRIISKEDILVSQLKVVKTQ